MLTEDDEPHAIKVQHWGRPWRRAIPSLVAALCSVVAAAQTAAPAEGLPPDVIRVVRERYGAADDQLRYLAGRVDLDGDAQPELIVHLVGPMVCGTGGCPTLVFAPRGTPGYRLVSTISVSRPPIRAASAVAAGWRNLIVHVAGGGAKAADVELNFDGKRYPPNPTVPGPRVRPAQLEGAEIVVADFQSFNQAHPLPTAAAIPAPRHGEGPSFDCAKAKAAADKRICDDAGLARLDRELAARYQTGLSQWTPPDQARQRQQQREWLAARNRCAAQVDAAACMRSTYQRRLIALQIANGELEVPTAVGYRCKGDERRTVFAVFYNQTEPRSAVLTVDDRQRVLFSAPSGSGARYVDGPVEFWEHHGEATIRWDGRTYVCEVL